MHALQSYLFAIGACQGLLLSFLLIFGSSTTAANRILGGWCLFLALSFLGTFITMEREVNVFSSLIGWYYFLPASYGAFLYLYCRHAITERPLSIKDLLHIIPIGLCYLLNIDILLASSEVKLAFVITERPGSISFFMSELIMYFQAYIYLGLGIVLIKQYQNKAIQTLSSFNPDIFNWLWKLLFLCFIIWTFKIAARLVEGLSILSSIGNGMIVVLIYSIAMAQWRNPRLFSIEQLITDEPSLDYARSSGPLTGQASEDQEKTSVDQAETPVAIVDDQSIRAGEAKIETVGSAIVKPTGALDASIRASLLQSVSLHMLEHQTYRDNQLTLARLSEAIGVTTHHLSEVLNQQEGKNFYQFVNRYRVDYICERMKKDQSLKILDLAMTAGFSSKSTFNTVFKQFTGLTPSQYRKTLTAV